MAETLKQSADKQETRTQDLEYQALPHNLEAEQALLGALLVNNGAAEKVQGFLSADHFFEPVHGRIYEAIIKLIDRGQTADPVKLKPYFKDDEALEDVGGGDYIVRHARTLITARRYLMSQQRRSGRLSSDPQQHALATVALSEMYWMTRNPILKRPAQRALDALGKEPTKDPYVWIYRVMARQSVRFAGLHALPVEPGRYMRSGRYFVYQSFATQY